MQVTRSLRYFRGHQSLRALQFFRGYEDVAINNSCHQSVLQTCASSSFHSEFSRRRLSSSATSSGKETFMSPDSSVQKAVSSKEKSTTTFQTVAASEEDDFDISEVEADIGQPVMKMTKTQYLLTEWCSQLRQAKDNDKKMEVINLIHPEVLSNAVHLALTDAAPSEMRVQCLQLLLCQEEDLFLVKKILEDVLINAQYFPIKIVANIVHMLSLSSSTELRSKVRRDLVLVAVNKRWFEIGPKHIVFFMYQLDELFNMKDNCLRNRQSAVKVESTDAAKTSASLKQDGGLVDNINLEKRLISLVDELKPRDLARVVNLMGKWRNRNQILLPAFVHRLSLADMTDFTLIQLSNLMFSCSILSLNNASLLSKTVWELASQGRPSSVLMSSILSSLSRLRWYDSALVSKYLGYLSDHVDSLSPRELWNVLISLANLYALPTSDKEVFVMKALGERAFSESKSSFEQVDIAWSMSILKLLEGGMAKAVLEQSFIHKFNGNSFQDASTLQKLRGISLAAKFEVDGYSGPFMEETLLNTDSGLKKSAVQEQLALTLHKALAKFVDTNSYVSVSQSLPGGLQADAVMCASSDGTPKPLADLEKGDMGKSLHRLAIQVIPFSGVLTSKTTPCGVHQMTSRHLQHLGYNAVQIPYSGLRESQSVLEQVNIIQSSIKKAVRRDTSLSQSSSSSSS